MDKKVSVMTASLQPIHRDRNSLIIRPWWEIYKVPFSQSTKNKLSFFFPWCAAERTRGVRRNAQAKRAEKSENLNGILLFKIQKE